VRVWFVVPVHEREALTAVCLRQLARTCDAAPAGVEATAVVIGEGTNLQVARQLGFGTVARENKWLGQKLNDGYQVACDPEFNSAPADYVIPCGSDDWVDPAILKQLPGPLEVGVFRSLAIVNEDRTALARMHVNHPGGVGIRIIPRFLIERAGYRPAVEDRVIGLDNSTYRRLRARGSQLNPKTVELDLHPLQIVDWKSHDQQIHSYRELRGARRPLETADVFGELAAVYPKEALDEMRELRPTAVAA
jgi:hypothetical protein